MSSRKLSPRLRSAPLCSPIDNGADLPGRESTPIFTVVPSPCGRYCAKIVRDIAVRRSRRSRKQKTASQDPPPKNSNERRRERSDPEPKQHESERKYLGDDQTDTEHEPKYPQLFVPSYKFTNAQCTMPKHNIIPRSSFCVVHFALC